jgi:hypothetical protein
MTAVLVQGKPALGLVPLTPFSPHPTVAVAPSHKHPHTALPETHTPAATPLAQTQTAHTIGSQAH